MKKAQVGIEYLVILGAILIILIPLFFYAISKSSENIRISQAEDAVNSLAKAADEVYSLSPGTKKYVWVNIPSGVEASQVSATEITLTIEIYGNTSDFTAFTKASMAGEIPTAKGTYKIPVELLESGIVLIGEGDDSTPPIVTWKYPDGLTCNPVILRANTDESAICKFDTSDLAYDNMSYHMSGSALGHNYGLGVQSEGDYNYYLRCSDAFDNAMTISENISYSINYTYCGEGGEGEIIETNPPIVTLISPSSGYISNTSRIIFSYNVTDVSMIFLCRLIAEGIILETVYEPEKDVTNNITGNLDLGTYNWSINCTDAFGNEGNSSAREIEVNATLDTGLPVVNLEAPINESIRNYNLIKFFYNVSDLTSAIYSCTLNLIGELDGGGTTTQEVTDYSVTEDQQEQLSLSLYQGNYTWNISCKDDSVYRNIGSSAESWWIRVNSTTEESFLNSCAGICGYEGYGNGACENNPAKCEDYCPGCYLPAGDEYCIGGPQSDTCCCIP
ncbi:MAG: hypothetical protein KKD75_02315 [Nanoarchaeota archaeon]|nr:hypothetical protein [Nanoarchaeota archaeon]MBU1632129.1 hypothetical protein [Nanoarchaeota archaeon]MBU1876194.1 hypothetical protein [Nanoarchaeota archaeon]